MSSNAHVPVLLGPVLEGLNVKPDGLYVDGTFGRGGHSGAILQQLNSDGRLIAIDRDPQAIASAPATLKEDPRFELIRCEIAELAQRIKEKGLAGQVDGLLLDLGVSSPQLDEAERGFSFLRDGPLDMRMDPDAGVSAAQWLKTVDEMTLASILRTYGEETQARRIARAVVAARKNTAIETTGQLAEVVASVVPAHTRKKHPATKTFPIDLLATGGRLCVISFHSLEDRLVKRFIRDASREAEQYRGMPDVPQQFRPKLKPVGKAIAATAEEITANRRARSAHLRIAERV